MLDGWWMKGKEGKLRFGTGLDLGIAAICFMPAGTIMTMGCKKGINSV